jgi:hypothetical protein
VHGLQAVAPQELTLEFDRHWPLQLCVPVGHLSLQALLRPMHVPRQSCMPDGQLPPQVPFSQVADPPPPGAVQAMQEVPQVATARLLAQVAPQRWKPLLQAVTQAWPVPQVTMPFVTGGQSAEAQQAEVGTHEPSPHFL